MTFSLRKLLLGRVFINLKFKNRKSMAGMLAENNKDMSTVQFIQVSDPVTKAYGWKVVSEDYDYFQEIATSCYGDMLHDDERNEKFGEALKRAIIKMHDRGLPARVLDIGTGTGLLAMLAAKYGADEVYACEAFLPVANTAAEIIAQNGFADKIKLIKKHSTDLTVGPHADLPYKMNILVSEVFDTELIGEGAINTFNHAHNVLLEEDCVVIPSKATIYGQLVSSVLARRWNKLDHFKVNDCKINIPDSIAFCAGSVSLHDIQLSQLPNDKFSPLSDPVPLFKFDFNSQKRIPHNENNAVNFYCTNTGEAHVVFMWWDLLMDEEGDILLSCAPIFNHVDAPKRKQTLPFGNPAKGIPWRDHWMQAVYFLKDDVNLKKNENYILQAWHDQYSLWFDVDTKKTADITKEAPVCTCGLHVIASRSRIGALNDLNRRWSLVRSMEKILREKRTIVYLGGFSFLGLIAGKLGADKVLIYLHQESPTTRAVLEKIIYLNGLQETVSVHESIESVGNVVKDCKELAVVTEPSFRDTLFPWDHLLFWKLKDDLLKMVNLSDTNVLVSPEKMSLHMCAVKFDDLWKISRPLGNCMGLKMNYFDDLIAKAKEIAQSSPEPQPLWEYPCIAKSTPDLLHVFNLSQQYEQVSFQGALDISDRDDVDGLVFWTKWDLYGDENICCGPKEDPVLDQYILWDMFERQGVHFYRFPTNPNGKLYKVTVDSVDMKLLFEFSES